MAFAITQGPVEFIKVAVKKGIRGTKLIFTNFAEAQGIRKRRRAGEELSYEEELLALQSYKDCLKMVQTWAILSGRIPLVGEMSFFFIRAWPTVFFPSTYEDEEDVELRLREQARNRVQSPVMLLDELDKATRMGGVKQRMKYDNYLQDLNRVIESKTKEEALNTLGPYLEANNLTNKRPLLPWDSYSGLPWQVVKPTIKAATFAPAWIPSFTQIPKIVIWDHLELVKRTDDLLVRDPDPDRVT